MLDFRSCCIFFLSVPSIMHANISLPGRNGAVFLKLRDDTELCDVRVHWALNSSEPVYMLPGMVTEHLHLEFVVATARMASDKAMAPSIICPF